MTRLCLLFLFWVYPLFAKIHILTIAYNRPEFISLQHRCLQKFLQGNWEHTIFINADTIEHTEQLMLACKEIGVRYHVLPALHDPQYSQHDAALNAVFSGVLRHSKKGPVLLLENDCFLLRPLDIEKEWERFDLVCNIRRYHIIQYSIPKNYPWYPYTPYISPVMAFFRLDRLPYPETIRWDCNHSPHTDVVLDTGGPTYHYLQKFSHIKKRIVNQVPEPKTWEEVRTLTKEHRCQIEHSMSEPLKSLTSPLLDFCENNDSIQFLYNNTFLHYCGGSNVWKSADIEIQSEKFKLLSQLIDGLITEYKNAPIKGRS